MRLTKYTSLFLILFNFVLTAANANTSREVFEKYPNQYFIETGSFQGDGIQMALDAGFPRIHSIELAKHYYLHCKQRFANNPNVVLWLGDSTTILPHVLKRIDAPATFWLDGHFSWGVNSGKGAKNSPILEELDAIGKHPIKTHTILIDDIRLLNSEHFDYVTLNDLVDKIMKINPNYQISFENGFVPNDVLVAFIP